MFYTGLFSISSEMRSTRSGNRRRTKDHHKGSHHSNTHMFTLLVHVLCPLLFLITLNFGPALVSGHFLSGKRLLPCDKRPEVFAFGQPVYIIVRQDGE